MSQFSKLTYTGSFVMNGSGFDPVYQAPYTFNASAALTVILSEAADGTISGTWSFSGGWAEQPLTFNGPPPQGGAITDSGTITGTEGHLTFTDTAGYFSSTT